MERKKFLNRARAKRWYENHKELAYQRTLEWKKKNPEKVLATSRKSKEKNKEKIRKRAQEYYQGNKNQILARHKRNRERDRLKVNARAVANRHAREGLIKKGPCLACGKHKTGLHHEDYSRPLEVVPLCITCDKRLHASGLPLEHFLLRFIPDVFEMI